MANSANGVFISYRREESGHVAGRLADRLGTRLSKSRIFIDVDRITPGEDFSAALTKAIHSSAVLIVIIGPRWLRTLQDQEGRRFDWVRREVSMALSQDVTVIPVLVDGATMPVSADLPTELQGLSTRNAVMINHQTFSADMERLVGAVMQKSGAFGTPGWLRFLTVTLPLGTLVGGVVLIIGVSNGDNGLFAAGGIVVAVFAVIFFVLTVVGVFAGILSRRRKDQG